MEAGRDGGGEELEEFLREATAQGALANPLTNQETAILLDRYRQTNAQATPGFCPPPMVTKIQAYLEQVAGSAGKNADAATEIRNMMCNGGVDGVEMALLINLMPENSEEAYALVPSLKRNEALTAEALDDLLAQLHSYQTFH